MADYNLLSDTNIYKNTYHELVCWVKELHRLLVEAKRDEHVIIRARGLEELNYKQAARIMELEFDLRRYSTIMVEDKQETLMKDYAIPEAEIVSNEEFQRRRTKRGGGSNGGDWLSGMEWGTQFYARMKVGQREPWMLAKFLFAGIKQKTAYLVPMAGDENSVADERAWLPVDPVRFCKTWELYDAFPPIPLEKEDE